MPATRGLAFTAAVWVIDRVHGHSANVRPNFLPTRSSCFSKRHVFMFQVSDLAHGRTANQRHTPHLPGRHAQLRVISFFGNELSKGACRPRHLASLAGS